MVNDRFFPVIITCQVFRSVFQVCVSFCYLFEQRLPKRWVLEVGMGAQSNKALLSNMIARMIKCSIEADAKR